MIDQIAAWSERFIASSGLFAVFFLSVIESIFFPIPTALIITAATAIGMDVITVVVIATIGSVIGAIIGYRIGELGGRPLAERVASKKHIDNVDRWFERYGTLSIGIAALTPIPYKVFVISAGIARMDMTHFVLISLAARFVQFLAFGYLGNIFHMVL